MKRAHFTLAVFACSLAPFAHAQRLPPGVVPNHYDLSFALDLEHESFDGAARIDVQLAQPTARIVLNALELEIAEARVVTGGVSQTARVESDATTETIALVLERPVGPGAARIETRYSAKLNPSLRGFYLSKTERRKYAVTQFESTDARRAFPCFDEPSFKATFALTVVVDEGDTAISNGKLVSDMPGPGAGRHTLKFAKTARMSSYLVAIAVGDYACLSAERDGVKVRVCATPEQRDLGGIALEAAQDILSYYNRYYATPYPFGKLDVVAVPDFAAGAMENTAAIFYRESALLADSKTASLGTRKTIWSILAHEMAHMWFGDLVTMAWWDDLWLNESFATWMAQKPLLAAKPDWDVALDMVEENQVALNLDALKATRAIRTKVETPAEIEATFDAIAYEKGGAVLRMVESYVGEQPFRKGVNAYLSAHAYGNATASDFWTAIATASGKPVDKILPTFVDQPGVPLLSVSASCANGHTEVVVQQARFTTAAGTAGNETWQIPVCVKVAGRTAPTCEVVSGKKKALTLGGACAPWVFANTGAQGYFRTAYSPPALAALAPRVAASLTPPERLSLVSDEWALVRAGHHTVADFLRLASGFGREDKSAVLDAVVGRLQFVDEYLADDSTRGRLRAFVRALLKDSFHEVGAAAAPADSEARKELRASVMRALGTLGDDPDVVAAARTAVQKSLSGGPPLDPSLAGTFVGIAARHADAALYDQMLAAADRASSPEERDRFLYSLTGVSDPRLVERDLEYTRSPALKSQDAALFLGALIRQRTSRGQAWSFLKDHWSELEPKITIAGGDSNLAQSVSAFCDPAARDDVKSFFAEHKLPAAARALQQALERIDTCVGMKERQTEAFQTWLQER